MRNDTFKQQIPRSVPQELNPNSSDSNAQILQLRAKLKSLKQMAQQKTNQLFQMNTKLRSEGLRNQKLKKQVMQTDEKFNQLTKMQVQLLFEKYKDNKQSPLFYNQNGLSPFQLVKIGQNKFQDNQSHICMVCYSDLQKGIKIMKLPCGHILHKQCAIQHLLYSRQCPACSKDLK